MVKKFHILAIFIILVLYLSGCGTLIGSNPTATEPPVTSTVAVDERAITPTTGLIPAPEATETPQSAPAQKPQSADAVIDVSNANQLTISGEAQGQNPFLLEWSEDDGLLGAQVVDGLMVYELPNLSTFASTVVESPNILLDFSTRSQLMAVSSDRERLEIREIGSGDVIQRLAPEEGFIDAVFMPDGEQIALTSALNIAFSIYDIASGEVLDTYSGFTTAAPVYSVKFSPDGRTAIWYARATVQTMNLEDKTMGPLLSHQDFVGGIDTIPERNWLAASTSTTTGGEIMPIIQLWETTTGEAIGELQGCPIIPLSVDFSPDGSLLAADCEEQILIWNMDTLDLIVELTGHTERVSTVKFSPDGTMLASGASDDKILLWKINP